MTLSTAYPSRLVLKDYEAIINASKAFADNPLLAETMRVIIIEEEDDEEEEEEEEEEVEVDLGDVQEDDEEEFQEDEEDEETLQKRENKFRAITTILTDCSKLEAFKWHSLDQSSTRPDEFWEALTKLAPNLQHLSFNFHIHELDRMKEMGISVSWGLFFFFWNRMSYYWLTN